MDNEVISELAAIERRAAGSDAERRAARALALRLRRSGRRGTRAQTLWMRPHAAPVHALICVVAIAGSVLSVDHETAGLALAAGALVALVADLAGVQVLRRLTYERATQNVVSPDPRGEDKRVRLVLTAAIDAPRAGIGERGALARASARLRGGLGGRLPGLHGFLVAALVALVGCCVARVALEDVPRAIGLVQLLPTVIVICALALLLDSAASQASRTGANAGASAVAAVLAIAAALDRRPPRELSVDVVLAGAGFAGALGMRRWVAEQRRAGVRGEQVCVLHIGPCGAGTPAWWTHEGPVLGLRYSRQLLDLAREVAAQERVLAARPVRGHGMTGARRARARRWPALAIGALDADGVVPRYGSDADSADAVDPGAVAATVAFTLALVAALDRDLAARTGGNAPPSRG